MRGALPALAIAAVVAGCGGGSSEPSLADLEPEDAVADLPGIGAVQRHYEYEEDELYINEVVVDVSPEIAAADLAEIMSRLAYYDRGERPVGGTVYFGAATTELSSADTPDRTSLFVAPGSEAEQLERAELFLEAVDELEGDGVVAEGDELQVRPGGFDELELGVEEEPSEPADARAITDAARTIREGPLAEIDEITVSSTDFLLRLDADIGERNLAAWEDLTRAGSGEGFELVRLRLSRVLESPDDAAIDACLRLTGPKPAGAGRFDPADYRRLVGPFVDRLLAVSRELGEDPRVEFSGFTEQPAEPVVCQDVFSTGGGEPTEDPLGLLEGGGER